MRASTDHLERYRIRQGAMASDANDGWNGAFRIPLRGTWLYVICSDQAWWDHVSVSLPRRPRSDNRGWGP